LYRNSDRVSVVLSAPTRRENIMTRLTLTRRTVPLLIASGAIAVLAAGTAGAITTNAGSAVPKMHYYGIEQLNAARTVQAVPKMHYYT
jgi:hypothetical protein